LKRRRSTKTRRRAHRHAARRARSAGLRPRRFAAHRLARRGVCFVMAMARATAPQKGATTQDRAAFRAVLA
jgi:hypothetical protein